MKTHKLKKLISLVTAVSLLLGLMLASTVSAAEKPTVSLLGAHVTISGSAGDMDNVICIVLKPGYSDVNQLSVDEFQKACHYSNDTTPENGTYSFSFFMLDDSESGTYTATVGANGTFFENAEFYYASKNDRLGAIDNIVKAPSADALTSVLLGKEDDDEAQKEYLNKLYNAMGFLIDSYAAMSEAQQLEINKALYASRGDYTGDDASDKAAVVFNNAIALSNVNHASDAEKMMQAITDYNSVFKFDLSEKGLYGSLASEEKELVYKAVYGRKPFEKEDDLSTAFNEELRVPYLNAIAYGDFVKFVEENNEYLNYDMDRFEDLNEDSQTAIAKEMAKADFDTIKQARTKFDDLLEKYEDEEDDNPGSGSSGGGGGSSGGGGNRGGNKVTDVYVGDKDKDDTSNVVEPSNEPYDDLESVTWAKDSILSLTEKGIVSGDGNKKFRPNDNIKREEFLKIALEAFNLVSDGAVCELDDVADNAWYYKYVASGMEKELVNGVDERHFGVGSEITRQDMATLAYRIAVYAGVDLSGGNGIAFSDEAEIGSYAKEAVAAMSANGIINGVGDGNFAPGSFATRAQACKIISQLLSLA